MDLFWQWRERIRRLFFKSRVEQEVLDEMQFHIEMEERDRRENGLNEHQARRSARMDFGNVERYREEAREARLGHGVDTLLADARYSMRLLRRHPGFTASAVAALALGIGTVTAVFSLVSSTLFGALPYAEPSRTAWIVTSWDGTPDGGISPAEYLDYREQLSDVFSHVGVYAFGAVSLTERDRTERLRTAFVSEELLPALGVEPIRGRNLTVEESESGANVILLSETLWRERFGARDDIIGDTISLNQTTAQVVGVFPESFRLPEEIWLESGSLVLAPLGIDPSRVNDRGSHFLAGVARPAAGVSFEHSRGAIEALARRWVADGEYPVDMGFEVTVLPLDRFLRGPLRAPVVAIFAAVGMLLLIACTNVAGLMLARTDLRAREMALRSSLGAERRRIIQQVVTESTVLGVFGGIFGLAVAALALAAARATMPDGFDWQSILQIDLRVVAFGSLLAIVTGIVFGLVPALALGAVGGRRLVRTLGSSSSNAQGSPTRNRWRSALVAAELALTLVLLVAAGLLFKSFNELLDINPGYRTENIAATRVSLPPTSYPENDDLVRFFREVTETLRARPEIDDAGAVTNLPLATRLGDMNFRIDGRTLPDDVRSPAADWQAVTPGYLETMGISLLEGRTFTSQDRADTPGVAVVNKTLAEMHWPGESPIGARFALGGEQTQPATAEIIGVVADVKHSELAAESRPQMYFSHEQFRFWNSGLAPASLELVVSSRLDPPAVRQLIAEVVRGVDLNVPLADFRTMEQVRAGSVAIPRLLMSLLGVFAVTAMLLATVGVYGVTAQVVGRRLPEFGLRLALGARRADISLGVLKSVVVLLGFGVSVGLLGAFAGTRLLRSQLFQVDPLDPAVIASVAVLLIVAALAAGLLAARRAAAVDPSRLLRSE